MALRMPFSSALRLLSQLTTEYVVRVTLLRDVSGSLSLSSIITKTLHLLTSSVRGCLTNGVMMSGVLLITT